MIDFCSSVVDKHYEQKIAKVQVKQEETGEQKISDEVATKQDEADEQQKDNAKNSIRFLQRARMQRLRQAVSHPFNLEKLFRQKLQLESILEMKSRLGEQVPTPVLQQLQEGESFADGLSKYLMGLRNLETMGPSAIGGSFNMGALLNLVENELSVRNAGCALCTKEKDLFRPTRASNVSLYSSICADRLTDENSVSISTARHVFSWRFVMTGTNRSVCYYSTRN